MLLLVLILGMDQLQGIDLTLDLLLGLLLALLMAYMVFGWLTLSRVTLTNVRIRLSITSFLLYELYRLIDPQRDCTYFCISLSWTLWLSLPHSIHLRWQKGSHWIILSRCCSSPIPSLCLNESYNLAGGYQTDSALGRQIKILCIPHSTNGRGS